MKKIYCATSFGKEGLELYAHEMVRSFIAHWPQTVMLKVYLDDIADAEKLPKASNVEFLHLSDPDLAAFKQRNSSDPRKNGYDSWEDKPDKSQFNKNKEGKWRFQYDAIRFCHKVFAINHCARSGCDIAIWLDGDTKTFANVSEADIESWLPNGKFSAFLDRPHSYTETGFHMFNMNHTIALKFFDAWMEHYKTDSVFNLPAWTDCHTYDAARKQFDRSLWHSLSPESGVRMAAHVFINGPLGKFMDHMKGKRKLKKSSNKGDLFVTRTEDYWKNLPK